MSTTRGPRVRPPYLAVSLTRLYMPVIPYFWIKSTISFNSCTHSKYATSGWYPASTSVSKAVITIAWAPPHKSTCSPNQSVSTSSLNVVCNTPGRVLPIACGFRPRLSSFSETDDELEARVLHVGRLSAPLDAVTDNCNSLILYGS